MNRTLRKEQPMTKPSKWSTLYIHYSDTANDAILLNKCLVTIHC